MTDQRTLKRIIREQRGTIEKQKVVIEELNEKYLKLNANFDVSDGLLGEANDELERYKEENFDFLYIEAFLREDLADLRKQIEAAKEKLQLIIDELEVSESFAVYPLIKPTITDLKSVKNILEIPRKEEGEK